MKGAVVTPNISSCQMLVPVKELWWIYGDVRVLGEG